MYLNKQIQKLCHEVSQETDDDRLLSLVNQLNRELDHASETENRPEPSKKKTEDANQSRQAANSTREKAEKHDAA